MQRLIDREANWPTKALQVICVGLPRTGTISLYQALNKLGYRTYHGLEFVRNGKRDMDLLHEALTLKYESGGKSYTRQDFDKVWGEYDAIIDLPGFAFVDELVAAYPTAKFILTDRDVDTWCTSMRNTVFAHMQCWQLFAQSLFDLKHARPLRRLMRSWAENFCQFDFGPGARQAYLSHVQHCKLIIPSDKLLVLRLEERIGWDSLCEFLGKPIPDEPYPNVNNTASYEQFRKQNRQQGLWRPLRIIASVSILIACAAISWRVGRHSAVAANQ